MTSSTIGVRATAASAAEKVGTSTTPSAGGEQDDLCMADLQPTLDPQATEVGGARAKDDDDRFLYIGALWEGNAIPDHRDIDDFKEASRKIGRTLAVRTWDLILRPLSLISSVLQGL